jgi:membrane associated rhomboid family serine protease
MESNPFLNSVRRSWVTMPPITKAMVVVVLAVHVLSIIIPAITTLGKSWGSIYSMCFDGRITTAAGKTDGSAGGGGEGSRVLVVGGGGGVGHYIWTFVISTWAHTGILHLLMNTLVLVTSGSSVEHTFGSPGAHLIFTLLLQIIVNGTIAVVYSFNLFTPACVMGISGVLFGYIAFECNLAHRRAVAISEPPPSIVFCGVLPMRSIVMPWFLLLIGIVLMPGSSTLGHFSGLVVGMAVAWLPPAFDALLTFGKCLDNLFINKLIDVCGRFKVCGGGGGDDGDAEHQEGSGSSNSSPLGEAGGLEHRTPRSTLSECWGE